MIVCTTFERREELARCLDSLAALDYPAFEVLVVDNRREDGGSVDWVERVPKVRLLRERRPGLGAARNRGLNAASGAIVAFTDDDVVVDPGWLTAFARRFCAHPRRSGVGGLTLPQELETEAQIKFEDYYGSMGPRVMEPVTHRLERLGVADRFAKPSCVGSTIKARPSTPSPSTRPQGSGVASTWHSGPRRFVARVALMFSWVRDADPWR